MQKYLIINSKSPTKDLDAQEAQDLYLALSAFGKDISLLFTGEGVLQLLKGQNLKLTNRKNFTTILEELDLFDIDKVYVEQQSLVKYKLSQDDLAISVTVVEDNYFRELINNNDVTLRF